jgi:hypothetical protein
VIGTVVVFLTEVTSNTATATVFMPIMVSFGMTIGTAPLVLMATVALASSMAFMLPVATPPERDRLRERLRYDPPTVPDRPVVEPLGYRRDHRSHLPLFTLRV